MARGDPSHVSFACTGWSIAPDEKGLENAHLALVLAAGYHHKSRQGVSSVAVALEQVLSDGSLAGSASALA